MLRGSLKKAVKSLLTIIALYAVFYLLVQAVDETENKYKGDLIMGAQHHTSRTESISVALTKEEKAMSREIRRHYGFSSDRELVIALMKRAHMNIIKNK